MPRWARRSLLALSIFAILAFAAASATFAHLNLHLPRRPLIPFTQAKSTYPNAIWQEVGITAHDQTVLRAWHVRPQRPTSRCVIVLHGISDNRSGPLGFAPMFLDHGYAVLLPDSRAHGISGGDLVTFGLVERYDIHHWTRWLAANTNCTAIYALGESLGAAIVLQAIGGDTPLRAVVAECAFSDLPTIARYRLARMIPAFGAAAPALSAIIIRGATLYTQLRYGLSLANASPEITIRNTRTPVLLIHGLADTATPPLHSQRLAQANPSAVLWLVPNATHTNASRVATAAFQSRVLAFFEAH